MNLSSDQIANSLRGFKSRRDSVMHEDVATFGHNLERFVRFCNSDPLVQQVLAPLDVRSVDIGSWMMAATAHEPDTTFPDDADDELALRYKLLQSAAADDDITFQLGIAHHQDKHDGWVAFFRTLVARPFMEELSHRLGDAANLATPEARTIQAVPLERVPSGKEVKIFLSHKSVDKPLVNRYYVALKQLGFDPWLDELDMSAGANLERELLRGFEESCAAVFFITESFRDEKYLATEIDYAIRQKRRKAKKFVIVTLRYTTSAAIPSLLDPFIFKDVSNDLEGFAALVRALPIEPGRVRWREDVVK